jgi:hypothetical protein
LRQKPKSRFRPRAPKELLAPSQGRANGGGGGDRYSTGGGQGRCMRGAVYDSGATGCEPSDLGTGGDGFLAKKINSEIIHDPQQIFPCNLVIYVAHMYATCPCLHV